MPAENKTMITAIKQNPVKTFLTLENEDRVSLSKPWGIVRGWVL
jgi:hypothetical protein